MAYDAERRGRIQDALREAGLDAVACALPVDVLLLTGYWPVVGTALALATRDGQTTVLVPEDEASLADQGGVDDIRPFQPGSLHDLRTVGDALRQPLAEAIHALRLEHARIGYEHGGMFEPATYAAMFLYGAGLSEWIGLAAPAARLVAADELLLRLRAVKTSHELSRIRIACQIAAQAFEEGKGLIHVGLRETEVAARFGAPLSSVGTGYQGIERAGGFAFCMSGPNSAQACGAYARSRARRIAPGDLVLVHCNSYADGFWTDITRTYCVGDGDRRQRTLFSAVLAASTAAIGTIRPGVCARQVDHAARDILSKQGFGGQFKHSTGHGVGFAAINHNAPPRLHPCSEDVLQDGMVFNVEPAIYMDGYGGLRHCTMVAVTPRGTEVLTPFQSGIEQLRVV